jgi:DNA-binding Lrp family transcriptional regulator
VAVQKNKQNKKPQNQMPKLNDAITYEIFKILAKDPNSTQRALANSLGVSLGKARVTARFLRRKIAEYENCK